jgi:hypothetical protein
MSICAFKKDRLSIKENSRAFDADVAKSNIVGEFVLAGA